LPFSFPSKATSAGKPAHSATEGESENRSKNLETSNTEHRAVVDAIRRGDWREAKALHAKHRARTSGEIINLLQKFRLARLSTRS
jgi:hypothetical protein